MRIFGRKARSQLAAAVVAGLTLGLLSVPTAALAAPSGSFSSLNFTKLTDGTSPFTNNPVDDSTTNNIVAINDFVSFKLNASTSSQQVVDATVTLTKPSCWVWANDVNSNLNYNDPGNPDTSLAATITGDTLEVKWNQASSGVLETNPFRVQAGPTCPNGSTWTPTLTYTDASGPHTVTLDTITVGAVSQADLSVSAVGAPGVAANWWFANATEFPPGGAVNAMHQQWRINLTPATLSKVGYTDPDNGDISFTAAFTTDAPYPSNQLRAQFQLPRNQSSCWSYVSPSAVNNGQYYPSSGAQTVTITMKTSGACAGMLTQDNTLYIDSYTPMPYVPDGCAVLRATVAPLNWTDIHGGTIAEVDRVAGNDTASTNICKQTAADGWNMGSSLFAPKVPNADYAGAYPWQSSAVPVVRNAGTANVTDKWGVVAGSNIGKNGEFVSETIHAADFANGSAAYTNMASYHFWDPTKQQLNKAKLGDAVMGTVAPSQSVAANDPTMDTKAFASNLYTVQCTTGFTGANSASAESMTWQDCAGLAEDQISGVRLLRASSWSGNNYGVNYPNSPFLFSQVPFIAVGDAGVTTSTVTRWDADQITNDRQKTTSVKIVGNLLLIGEQTYKPGVTPAEVMDQVQPNGKIDYVITPQVSQPAGTFLPYDVENLKVVNTLDVGIASVDLSGLDPFWTYEIVPANLGPDGTPYTNDGGAETPMQIIFKPAGPVTTATVLPKITYTATMGIVLPKPADPYVKNSVVITADDAQASATANKSLLAVTPQMAFFSKKLISDPVIEVEDEPVAWRVEWVNYNNYDLGKGYFVDVFPYNGDGRGTDFDGTLAIEKVERIGSAQRGAVKVQMTSDAPGTVGAAPATATAWHDIDPSATPADWAAAVGGTPTAIRIEVPNIEKSADGYGAVDLRFKAQNHREGNIYYNDATGRVADPQVGSDFDLGKREADPVRVIASSIAGVAWVDKNSNGLRDSGEPLLKNVPVSLYRAGHGPGAFRTATTDANGAYKFDNLHSSSQVMTYALGNYEYQVVFDVPGLTAMGYKLTEQLVDGGVSHEIDSDADVTTGEVAALALAKNEDVVNLDAGVLAIGPQATITADASMDRTYNWNIEKSATNKSGLAVAADGSATVEYEAEISEVDYTDANAQLSGDVVVTNPTDDKTYTINATVAADGTGLTCTVTGGANRTLAPLATLTLPYTCTGLPGTDLDRTVTATVAAVDQDPLGTTIPDLEPTADATYALSETNKTVNVKDIAAIAGVAQPATDFGPYTWGDDPSGVYTESYDLDATVPQGDCLAVVNTATIVETGQNDTDSLTACLPLDLAVSKNVVTSMQTTYGWSIAKSLANPGVTLDANGNAALEYEVVVTEGAKDDAASTMSGKVTVTNPNKYKSVDIAVTDVVTGVDGGPVCTFAAGSTVTLAAEQTRALDYSCTFASEPTVRDGVNTATVTWDSDVAGTDRALTDTGKTATATAAINAGDWVLTEFQKTVNVTDSMEIDGAAQADRAFGPYTWSAEGTEHRETYAVQVSVDPGTCALIDNTAVLAAGSTRLGDASTSHTLCNEADLTVADPSTASLLRTYAWSIEKSLTNRDEIAEDQTPKSVDSDWQVKVTEGAYAESAHQLAGRVIITNPNDYKSYVVDVTNGVTINGLTCKLPDSSGVVIPAGQSVELPYTCKGNPGNVYSGAHTVEVTGADIDTITHSEPVQYAVNETGKTIDITDDKYTFSPKWKIEWSEAGKEHVRDYTLPVKTAAGECQTFVNTAFIKQTGQKASDKFKVCVSKTGGPGTGDPVRDAAAKLAQTGGGYGILPALGAILLAAGVTLTIRRRRSEAAE